MQKPWVFFDIGQVLVAFSEDDFLRTLAYVLKTTPRELIHYFGDLSRGAVMSRWQQFEILESGAFIHEAMCRDFEVELSRERFEEAFASGPILLRKYQRGLLLQLLEQLRQSGVSLGLISNVNPIHAAWGERNLSMIYERFEPRARFHSCSVGMRKDRDGAMFVEVFRRCGIENGTTRVLIDDRQENLEGFKRAGGRGILFSHDRGFHFLEEELRAQGILLS